MWKPLVRKKSPPEPPRFGRIQPTDSSLICEYYGTFKTTDYLCVHRLTCKRVEAYQQLSAIGTLGRTITRQMVEAERRDPDRTILRHLLALDQAATHLVAFGFEFRHESGGSKELFRAAMNFSAIGMDTNSIAIACCEFVAFNARDERSERLEDGSLIPPPTLTQSKVFTRVFWATAMFKKFRSIVIRD